jgi:hypothetical protein
LNLTPDPSFLRDLLLSLPSWYLVSWLHTWVNLEFHPYPAEPGLAHLA